MCWRQVRVETLAEIRIHAYIYFNSTPSVKQSVTEHYRVFCFDDSTRRALSWLLFKKLDSLFMYTGKLPSTLIGWRRSTARPITLDLRPGGPAWITPLQRLDHFDTIQVLRNGPLRYTIAAATRTRLRNELCLAQNHG